MPSFQNTPVVSSEELSDLLYIIHNTFNTNGKVNTFQLNRIASSLLGNALFTALRTTNSREGFEAKLVKNYRAAYGIANGFNFTPDFDWNVNSEHDKFFSSKVPSEESVMKKILIRMANKYGISDKVTIENASDVIMEMEFADVTELDEKWNDTSYKNNLHTYMKENKDEVNDIKAELTAQQKELQAEWSEKYTITKTNEDNEEGARLLKEKPEPFNFKMLIANISADVFLKPEPVIAFERLQADANKSVATSRRLAQETWDKVQAVIDNIQTDAGLDTLDGTDGLDGEERYKLVQAILRNFDWSQKDCNDKLGEIALNPEMENMESLHEDNLNGALAIIPVCNTIIERADEVYKSNTSDELSRVYEEGSSNNLSDDGEARHNFEVDNNLPHGTVGQ